MKSMAFSCFAVGLSLLLTAASEADAQTSPTEYHKALAREAGVWDAKTTFWMSPDASPMEGTAVETNTMLGQFWLVSDFEGGIGNIPFKGHATLGYDPKIEKYTGTWVDTMGPYLYTMEGTYDVSTHTLTMMSTGRNVQTGKEETTKNVTQYKDENTKVFTIYGPSEEEGEEWWKMMEIEYTKRK